MEVDKKLTPKEKIAFWGLVRYPTLNDRELAEEIDMKLSTVTAIRRRLRQRDLYQTMKIPILSRMGFELFVLGYGSFKQDATSGRVKVKDLEKLGIYDSIFLSYFTPEQNLYLGASRNYTEMKRSVDELHRFFQKHKNIDNRRWMHTILPYELCTFLNYFDFTAILNRLFGYEPEKVKVSSLKPSKVDVSKMSKKERKVFLGLIRNPEEPDNVVAKKVNVSRQAVSLMAKRFESSGLLKTVRVPNLKAMGFEILGFAKTQFAIDSTIKDRTSEISYLLSNFPQFLTVSTDTENVMIGAFRNYEEYTKLRSDILSVYEGHEKIEREPVIKLFPINDIKMIRNFQFNSLLDLAWTGGE